MSDEQIPIEGEEERPRAHSPSEAMRQMPDPDAIELPEPETVVVTEPSDVFRRMDLEDERQIMEELQGRALDTMLYSFEVDGTRTTGFSWKGAREAVRTLNARGYTQIRMSPGVEPRIEEIMDEEGEEAYRVVVYAEDGRTGGGNWGIATAPKKAKRRSGDRKPDPFAVHKALSKAQRNAFEALIPIELVEYLKAQYLGAGHVKTIPGAGSIGEIERPPPLTDEHSHEQRDQARALYAEIRSLDPLVMPPGQFTRMMQAHEHDHERLDEMIEALEVFLEGERKVGDLREQFRQLVGREVYDREIDKLRGMDQNRRIAKLTAMVEQAEEGQA